MIYAVYNEVQPKGGNCVPKGALNNDYADGTKFNGWTYCIYGGDNDWLLCVSNSSSIILYFLISISSSDISGIL